MTELSLVLALLYAFVTFVLRSLIQIRRTGDSGWRMGGPKTLASASAHLSLSLSPLLILVGLVLELADAGAAGSWDVPAGTAREGLGLVLVVAGLVLTVAAQLDLGASWRIGVDEEERTALVTDGLYRWVRNPIFTGMSLFLVGEAVLVPNPWTVAGAVLAIVGMEVQTRLVEEPYLVAVHGSAYEGWASTTGRFLPAIGRR
jgi:protein-S-isoprenylcysteine O-methyltransferase Ste14